eukprot:95756-Prorocentrum_minimum.AAC.2
MLGEGGQAGIPATQTGIPSTSAAGGRRPRVTAEEFGGVSGLGSLGLKHIPGVGTNHRGLESIFQGLEPITGTRVTRVDSHL